MPRHYRRGNSLRPINSVKNIFDSVTLGVAAGVVTNVFPIATVNDYTGAAGTVPIGSKVSSIYIFVQIIAASAVGVMDFFFAKNPGAGLTFPVPGATSGDPNRRWILHEEKGIPGQASAGAAPLTFRGVIKLPRGMQRMAESDNFTISLRGSVVYDACVKVIYKFYQ